MKYVKSQTFLRKINCCLLQETQLPSEESGGPTKPISNSMSMGAIRALDSTIPQTHQFTHHTTSQNNNAG